MWNDLRAELTMQRRRAVNWILLAVALSLDVLFGYLIPYLSLGSTRTDGPGAGATLDQLLPKSFALTAADGVPLFIGALAAIFGALVVGSEYGWDTWKTVLVQTPSRLRVLGAKLSVIIGGVVLTMLGMLAVSAVCSAAVASAKGQPLVWPALTDILAAGGSSLLVLTMWALIGATMGILLRGIAIPISLTLVWMLVIQNLLTGLAAPVLTFVADLNKFLPGPAAGTLVANLGARQGTPGIESITSSTHAIVVVVTYLLGAAAVGGWVFARRDIA